MANEPDETTESESSGEGTAPAGEEQKDEAS